jgi:transmembrane sensor
LAPNQQLTVRGDRMGAPVRADAAEVASWTTGRLNFRAAALADAVAEVNRYARNKVVLDGPPELGREPVSGVFNAGDTAAFVSAAETLFDLRSATDADGRIHLSPRPPSNG